ncbi:hypothetical protein SAY86_011841 [Trapa natans]|uniref:Uncharacterized protein n=1 Tax=Trapa natans TaxID=22666 RepID=A0AAN7R8P3_TRANT|nr:hypothetical protein SAY86_011841 [Trapa natans]
MQLSALEVASRIPIKDPRSITILDQLLRFLSIKFLLKSSLKPKGVTMTQWVKMYGITDVTQHMVTNKDDVPKDTSIAPLVIFGVENMLFQRMSIIKVAILDLENLPFFTSHKANLFDVSSKNPILNKSLNEVIVFWSPIVIRRVLATYKGFEEVKDLLNVRG